MYLYKMIKPEYGVNTSNKYYLYIIYALQVIESNFKMKIYNKKFCLNI